MKKFYLKVSVILIAICGFFYSCQKTESKRELINSHSLHTSINPSNTNNPYDFAGEYIAAAFAFADGITDENSYKNALNHYYATNSLTMFSDWSPISTIELDILHQLDDEINDAGNIEDKVIIFKSKENSIVSDETLSDNEKERLLYIISSMKFALYLNEVTGIPVDFEVAITHILELIGYHKLSPDYSGSDHLK